jgi:hypothetical protein
MNIGETFTQSHVILIIFSLSYTLIFVAYRHETVGLICFNQVV